MNQIRADLGRFFIAGMFSTAINFCVYVSLHAAGIALMFASGVGYAAGLLASFELGRSWVFSGAAKIDQLTVIKFVTVYAFSGIGMVFIIETLVKFLSLDYLLAWVIGATFAVFINFAASRQFVFNNK